MDAGLARLCGQLLVGGFAGSVLPMTIREDLAQGLLGGVILFRRNISSPEQLLRLTSAVQQAAGKPVLIAVDEEGGRVSRLPAAGLPTLPPARELGARGDAGQLRCAGRALGRQLTALGINVDFAPVLDVDSNPANPVIGDRAYSSDPAQVARLALALAAGLEEAGVVPCGKHFPGHGDTSSDSHLELPCLPHDRSRMDRVELVPFKAAVAAGLPSLMSAHILFPAMDQLRPATLSPNILDGLLRRELGFTGAVFSDCLEMKAIADGVGTAEGAVQAIAAGCDLVLICHTHALQKAALSALVSRASTDPTFLGRCEQAAAHADALRQRLAPASPEPPEKRLARLPDPDL